MKNDSCKLVLTQTNPPKPDSTIPNPDKNDFCENGQIRIRFDTPEERAEIIRILETRLRFRVSKSLKQLTGIDPYDTRTFDLNIRTRSLTYSIRPMIGGAMMTSGVRFYSAAEFIRLSELDFKVLPRFPVFHIPHDGTEFPEELMASVCVPPQTFRKYHKTMQDTDITCAVPRTFRGGDMCCNFHISRLLCDVERFIGPEEIMEKYGMGFCYEKAYDGTLIKRVDDDLREKTLKYYREHHDSLDRICARHPRILLLDMHSYSDKIVPKDQLRPGRQTPDLCIGTDERFTPPALAEIVRKRFSEAGFTTALNEPYAGCLIPNAVLSGRCGTDCAAIMLEINKRTYCDRFGRSVPEKLKKIRDIVTLIMADCVDLKYHAE